MINGIDKHILIFYKICHFCHLLPFATVGQKFRVGLNYIPEWQPGSDQGIKDNMEYLQHDYILTWTAYE